MASRTNGIGTPLAAALSLQSTPPSPAPVRKLNVFLVRHIAQFLPKADTVSSMRACKAWNHSIDDPSIWKRLIGAEKADVIAAQNNIRTGRCTRREIPYAAGFEAACQNRLSNCFVSLENSPDSLSKRASIYGLDGSLLCTIDLLRLAFPEFHCSLTYATARHIILIYQKAHTIDTRSKTYRTVCAIFSRTGEFLRTFDVLKPKSGDCLPIDHVVTILESPDQLVFAHNEGTSFATYDLNGKQLFDRYATSGHKYFCKESRSFFSCYVFGDELRETRETGQEKRYPLSWSRQGPPAPKPLGICANGQLLCVHSNRGEIDLWDYKTGERLLQGGKLPICDLPLWGDPSLSISLVGQNILASIPTHDGEFLHVLCDRTGKQKFHVMHDRPANQTSLLPFHNHFLKVESDPFSLNETTWTILDSQGRAVRYLDVLSRNQSRLCHATPTCLSFPCQDRVVILDFGSKQLQGPQEKSADSAVQLNSGCCVLL